MTERIKDFEQYAPALVDISTGEMTGEVSASSSGIPQFEQFAPPLTAPTGNIEIVGNNSVVTTGALQSPNYTKDEAGYSINSDGTIDAQELTTKISSLIKTFTAGEAITEGNAIAVGDGAAYDNVISQLTNNTQTSEQNWFAQTFTTGGAFQTLKFVNLYLTNQGSSSPQNFVISIRATSSNLPTGADLESKTVTVNIGTGLGAVYTFTFGGGGVTLAGGTTYAIVIKGLTYSGPTGMAVLYKNSNVYSGGQMCRSTDSGSTWAAFGTADFYFSINAVQTVAGFAYKTKALISSDLANNFIGFANKTVSSGAAATVDVGGVNSNLANLTGGISYCLSDTAGEITPVTSPGTVLRKIGLALNATELLIKFDNP